MKYTELLYETSYIVICRNNMVTGQKEINIAFHINEKICMNKKYKIYTLYVRMSLF